MKLQQSYSNPYSRLLKKDYGTEHPQTPWIDRHGEKVVALICIVSAVIVALVTFSLIPAAIEQLQEASRQIVATSKGEVE